MIPKSVKFQSNLTEAEIRAYYSLRPLDEDYADHDKRFSKILNDYLETKNFKTSNARNCYKKQLKKMNKEDKRNTPKFKEFNMWRLKEIEKHISRQKTYLLQREGKVMPKRPEPAENNNDELINENKKLKLEIEKLKKQLQEKDEQIDYLMVENTKMKHMPQEVEEEKPKPIEIHEIEECLIIETSEEEEEEEFEGDSEDEEEIYVDVLDAVEDLVNNVVSLREALDDSDEEESDEESEEEEESPKQKVSKKQGIEIFQKICIDKIPQYHEEFMKLKEGKNDRDIRILTNHILDKYDEEVIQPNVEKLDDVYDLPQDEYTQVQEKPYEKMKDKIIYFSD